MNTKLLKQKILDLAIRGKLVPQDPNDEPASELLKSIRAEKEKLIAEGKIKRSKKTGDKPHYGNENAPFEIPESWEWVKLDELAQYKKGPFGSSLTKAMFVKEGVDTFKVYEQKNAIQKDSTIGTYYISKEHFERLNAFEVQPNDIIVSCAGTIGETYILPKDIKRGVINQALMFVRLYLPTITPFYLIYFDFIIKSSSQQDSKGTAIKNIPPFEILKNYLFPLPPLQEQERIIAEVEKWFALIDKIEDNKQDLQDYIKQTKSKILSLAIHGKLVPQDSNDEPAIKLLKRINPNATICDTSHYGNLPTNWSISTMSNLCRIIDGEKQSNINRIYLDVKYLRGKSDGEYLMSGKFVPANSTMILVDGENSGEIFTTTIDGYQGSTFKILDISEEMYKPFVLYVILSYQKQLRENKVGSAIPHLNKKLFREIVVEVPPYEEHKRIVNKIDELFSFIDSILLEL